MSKDRQTWRPSGESAPGSAALAEPGVVTMIMEVLGVSRGFTIGALFFVALLTGGGLYLFFRSAPPTTITITTGPEGSIFHTNAMRYAAVLSRYGVKLRILTSHGSLENLQRLGNPAFPVDVGFVQSGMTNDSSLELVSLGSVSQQPLLIFYRGAPIDLLSALAGRRVVVGPVGSGTHSLALTLLAANGVKPGGTNTLLDWEPQAAAKALLEGKVDAVFLMGEDASTAVMRELLHAPQIHLFSFKQAVAYTRRFTYLSTLDLPEGAIDFGEDIPAHDVYLISPTVELLAREHLHPALSDLLLEAAREVHGKASLLQRKAEFPAPLEHDFPLSLDAIRFYKSGKSFFYRYLPFWLASLTSRIVVVIIPLLVVSIPILRSIPQVYRWRVRSRIFRRYRVLLALERELLEASDSMQRETFLKRLDEIEKSVNRMRVPASFADQFYSLRGHIDFVRRLVDQDPAK
jgi:hypothetical protein